MNAFKTVMQHFTGSLITDHTTILNGKRFQRFTQNWDV